MAGFLGWFVVGGIPVLSGFLGGFLYGAVRDLVQARRRRDG